MIIFHLNVETSRVGICEAKSPENCPVAKMAPGETTHFETRDEAKRAYEQKQKKFDALKSWKKKDTSIHSYIAGLGHGIRGRHGRS